MTKTTTDLQTIREHRHLFTWGYVKSIKDIGNYSIVEYYPENHSWDVKFHIYVNGKCTSHSCESLEKALILAIAFDKLGVNNSLASHMADAAFKILSPDNAIQNW